MNITQLEADKRASQGKIAAAIAEVTRACAEHVATAATGTAPAVTGRLMTTEERARLDSLCAEGEAIQEKINRAQADAAMLSRLDKLTGGAGTSRPTSSGDLTRTHQTLGAQFVQSAEFVNLIKNRSHRGTSAWSTGAIECFHPTMTMRATTLTEDAASGGKLVMPQVMPGVRPLMFKRLVVSDLIAPGTTDSNAIIYMVETVFTNAAAPVAEGIAKPESTLVFDQKTDPVSKIAHWIPVTEELLEDVPAIQSYIDARLELGVQLAEEDQLLNGNGTPPNLLGILNRSGLATAVARNAGATPPESNADALLRQITAIATTSFIYPEGIVMNPTNWFTIQTSKDNNLQYFGGGPFSPLPTASLWGLPLAPTPTIVAGTALVGAFNSQAQIFRKGGIRIEASNSHQDFFTRNLVAVRAEERLALAVYRPGSFGKVTGLN